MILWGSVIILWIAVGIAVAAPIGSNLEKVSTGLAFVGGILLVMYFLFGGPR